MSSLLRQGKWNLYRFAAAAVILAAVCLYAQGEEAKNEPAENPAQDIWQDDAHTYMDGRGPSLEKRYDMFLSRIEEENPQRAEELKKLRNEDPEKFQQEIQKEFSRRSSRPGPEGPEHEPRGPMGPGRQGPGPDGQPDGPRFGGSGRWQEQLQKRHEEFIQWLEKTYPEQAFELASLREKDAAAYVGRLMELRKKFEPILHAEKNNPELAEVLKEDMSLQRERDELLRQVRRAKGDKREKMMEQLETIVTRRFDLIIRKKTLQYEELEQRLKRLQEEVKKRQQEVEKLKTGKEEAVKDRVKELTSDTEKIPWD